MVLLAVLPWIWILVRRIHSQQAIRSGARKARKAERERIAELKRLKKQDCIAIEIWCVLVKASNGKLTWKLRQFDENGPDVVIEIVSRKTMDQTFDVLATITIDTRRPKSEQVIITTGLFVPGTREKFGVDEGKGWIKSFVVPELLAIP